MTTKELPVSVGAKLLDINRTSTYYKGTFENIDECIIKKEIYVQGREVLLELVCDSKCYIEEAGKFAEKYGCVLEVIGI